MQQTRSILLATATAIVLIGGIGGFSSTASACNVEPLIGSVCAFAFNWCPRGFVPADGRTLAVNSNQALFSLIGYQYGGNNSDQFKVPDLRARAVYGNGTVVTSSGNMTVNFAQQVGQQAVVLSQTQVPLVAHAHTAQFTGTGGGAQQITVPAVASTLGVTASLPLSTVAPTTTTTTPGPVAGNENYIGAMTGFVKPASAQIAANFAGPFTTSTTAPTGGASSPVTATVTGSPGNPEIKFNVQSGITGGTVAVAPATQAASQAVPTQSPGLGMTYCIVTQGLYPDRP